MSAFLCSAKHLSALVNATRLAKMQPSEIERYLPVAAKATLYEVQTPQEALFGELLDTNLQSIAERYPDATKIEDWHDGGESSFIYDSRVNAPSIAAAIKLAHCYSYQSCEHEGWNDSAAKRYVDELVGDLIRQLPGYNEAEWAI
jgi:hypothetical protein